MNDYTVKSSSFKSYTVNSHERKWFTCCLGIGRNIFSYTCLTSNKTMCTNPDELRNTHISFQDSPVFDGDMTRQVDGVGKNYIIANDAIVCNMHISHQKTIISNHSFAQSQCAFVNSYHFTDGTIVAELCSCVFTLVFQ